MGKQTLTFSKVNSEIAPSLVVLQKICSDSFILADILQSWVLPSEFNFKTQISTQLEYPTPVAFICFLSGVSCSFAAILVSLANPHALHLGHWHDHLSGLKLVADGKSYT